MLGAALEVRGQAAADGVDEAARDRLGARDSCGVAAGQLLVLLEEAGTQVRRERAVGEAEVLEQAGEVATEREVRPAPLDPVDGEALDEVRETRVLRGVRRVAVLGARLLIGGDSLRARPRGLARLAAV